MSVKFEPETLFHLAQRHWHRPSGLLFTIVAMVLLESLLLKNIKGISLILVYLATGIGCTIVWRYSNRLPKTHKGKVGFAVCIRCADEKQEKIIKEDFVTTLRALIKEGPIGQTFHFIDIPRHVSESINDIEAANQLRSKTKSHFLVFGRVRLRTLNGKECHIIDLEAIVTHKPLPEEISNQIAEEFGELFPRRVRISTENEFLSFMLTSDWTLCVSKYIIGMASAYSFDLNYAEKLYIDVQAKVQSVETNLPVFTKLNERLPVRFSEIYIARSKIHLNIWWKTQDEDSLSQLSINLTKIHPDFDNNYDVLLLRSVEAFLNGRRVKDAIGYIRMCKHIDDPIWHFNLGFLSAYEGNLKKATQQYSACAKYQIHPTTISQVEDFMVWLLKEEPERYQYYYCLGYFNWKIKGDLQQSLKDFQQFLKHIKKDAFPKEKELTLQWVSEIQSEMNDADS